MNTERIKELAREAAGGMLSYDAEGEWRLSEREVGKLTELIVRECIKICSDVEADTEMDLSDGALVCMVEIKEHFGVEE